MLQDVFRRPGGGYLNPMYQLRADLECGNDVARTTGPSAGIRLRETAVQEKHAKKVAVEAESCRRVNITSPLAYKRVERHGFEFHRHGRCPVRCIENSHWSRAGHNRCSPHQPGLRRFPQGSCRSLSAKQQIHIILDNLSAHETVGPRDPSKAQSDSLPLHTDLLFMAESGSGVVR